MNLSEVGTCQTVSDIVRLALSAEFGGENMKKSLNRIIYMILLSLLALSSVIPSTAQSFPSLSSSTSPVTTNSAMPTGNNQLSATTLGQTLTMMSLGSTDSEGDFLEPNRVLAELEDDEIGLSLVEISLFEDWGVEDVYIIRRARGQRK